jgi:hypothetical protein
MSQPLTMLPNGGANRVEIAKDWVHDRYAGGKDSRTPTPGFGTSTWTSILSAECQKRHFNPQFTEWINFDGTHQCVVDLNGIRVNDTRSWSSAIDAKQELAYRAVEYIRKTPIRGGLSHREQEKASSRAESKPNFRAEDRTKKSGAVTEQEEERRLLTRIQSLYGRNGGPSMSVMADPAASRAFLEGFALGGKLRESSRDQRRRSRSPLRGDRGGRRGSFDGYVKRE